MTLRPSRGLWRALLVLPCACLTIIGCASAEPRFTPVSGHSDSFYLDDHHFGVSAKPASDVRVAVERNNGQTVLLLACRNTGADRIDLWPEKITVERVRKEETNGSPMKVLSRREYVATIKNQETAAQWAIALSGAVDTATAGDGTARQVSMARTESKMTTVSTQTTGALRAANGSLLGRETLLPGQGVFGEVRIESTISASDQLRVTIPIGEDRHVICFTHAKASE